MKKILLVLATVLLAPGVLASVEEIELGPYEVSFDLGSARNCEVHVQELIYGKTYSSIDYVDRSFILDCDGERVQINVTHHQSPVAAGDEVTRIMSRRSPPGLDHYVNVETREQVLDGHSGFLTTFESLASEEVFQGVYWLDRYLESGEYLGQTSCRIASSLPWKETSKLLNSVHVEPKLSVSSSKEVVKAGPYEVSFDLGEVNYTVGAQGPKSGETHDGAEYTTYGLVLESGIRSATVEITGYNEDRLLNAETDKLLVETSLRTKGFVDVSISDREIDGKPGVIGIGEDPDHNIFYQAAYWPDSYRADGKIFGTIFCEIESDHRWDVTKLLLDSIHVEPVDEI